MGTLVDDPQVNKVSFKIRQMLESISKMAPKIKASDEPETSWLQGPTQQIILILD